MDSIPQIRDNEELKRFELEIQGKVAFIEYIKAQDNIYLTHTEVPMGLEGKGIGSMIIGQVLEEVKANKWALVPLCPFVAAYLKRHPEWKEILMDGINID
jgi:predicted GNAT family acetyltransferase